MSLADAHSLWPCMNNGKKWLDLYTFLYRFIVLRTIRLTTRFPTLCLIVLYSVYSCPISGVRLIFTTTLLRQTTKGISALEMVTVRPHTLTTAVPYCPSPSGPGGLFLPPQDSYPYHWLRGFMAFYPSVVWFNCEFYFILFCLILLSSQGILQVSLSSAVVSQDFSKAST